MSTLNEAPICAAAVAKLRGEGWKVACEIEVFDFRDKAGLLRELTEECVAAATGQIADGLSAFDAAKRED